MGKGVKKKDMGQNIFVMRGSNRTYYSHTVRTMFENLENERGFIHPSMRQLNIPKLNLPTFNFDQAFFTPAFKLPSDQLEQEHYKMKHSKKLQQYQPINESQIMMPRPKDKRYCHVCQEGFDDYQEVLNRIIQHIDSQGHSLTLRQSKFQHRIQKLCRKLSKRELKVKIIKSSIQSDREESYDVCESKQNNHHSANLPPTTD